VLAVALMLLAGEPGEPGVHRIAVAPTESLRVTMAGTGAPIILVPGLFGSAFGYRSLIPQLVAGGYRAIVIEPLGIGGSSRPERADYSLTAQADRIAAALDSLGLSHVVVVAHSVGASMAYRLAVRRPDLVRGVVSLDGGPAEAAATRGFRRAMRFVPWIKLFGGVRLIRGRIRRNLLAASGDSGWVTDAVVNGYTAEAAADLDGTLKAYLGMARAREPERLVPRLGEIRCPVLLLVGGARHQSGISAREVALLRSQVLAFTIDTVDAAGHYLQEERPEAVAAAVRRLAGGGP
jgi:pimeloyl-ACP methyl ester carboxylesterase